MGGGKSRALCEEALDMALEFPGLVLPIFRQKHVAITGTTRRTFFEQVLPLEMREHCKIKASGGEDYCRLPNGSELHFVGLDDPGKWFSSELGAVAFDEAHEMSEVDVLTLGTRLRQRCQACVRAGRAECEHMPHSMMLGFNPAHPGHWLQRWFFVGATPTQFGFAKAELFPTEATAPIGDAEFVFAKAKDNPYLPSRYVEQALGGMPAHLRRRYLEGLWEFVSGSAFFDQDALGDYHGRVSRPRYIGRTVGDVAEDGRRQAKGIGGKAKDPLRFRVEKHGGLWVWAPPVRARIEDGERKEAHRYVVAVDAASGGADGDFAAIQVIDVDAFAQVAEFQGRLEPDELALEAYRLGRIYNDALVAPEVTGGWGFSVVQALERLHYRRLYTRRVEDRLAKRFTDKLGWDTTIRSRAVMLDALDQALREREFALRSERTLMELGTFVWPDKKNDMGPYRGVPSAQPGCHDDLVMALAIGVYLAISRPKTLRREVRRPVQALVSARTGY